MKALTEALPLKYRDFLTLTELIITEPEKEVFLQIKEDYQRDKFIDNFWKRRTIDSIGIRTDYRAVYTRRVQQAIEQFGDLHNDRAKIFVLQGPPEAVIPIDCQDIYVPLQIWYYERMEVLKSKLYLIFYQPYGMAPVQALAADRRPRRAARGRQLLARDGHGRPGPRHLAVLRVAHRRAGDPVLDGRPRLGGVLDGGREQALHAAQGRDGGRRADPDHDDGPARRAPPRPRRRASSCASRSCAPNKIGMDLSLLVPKSELKARALGEETFYNVDVIGEVVKDDRLIDNFKYRFDIPTGEIGGEKIPLTVRRYLYPGDYKLVLKISDGNQNAEGRHQRGPDRPRAARCAAAPDRGGARRRQGRRRARSRTWGCCPRRSRSCRSPRRS